MKYNYTDKDILDFLDKIEPPVGYSWILRESTTGRGIRLHHISNNQLKELGLEDYAASTARQAISNYMNVLLQDISKEMFS